MRLQRTHDVAISRVLREAAADAERATEQLAGNPGFGAMVRDAQLRSAQTALARVLSELWMQVGEITKASQEKAREIALAQSFDWDAVLLKTGISAAKRAAMKEGLLSAGQFNIEAALERVYTTRIPLSEQVWRSQQLSNGWLDRVINSALARGATPAELAKDVRKFVRPDSPGGVAYAAKRLGRTEVNNAYHAVTIVHNEDKPWNLGMQWNLSGSHPVFDECDDYARRNRHQLGAGVFPKNRVPKKPHPQCLCYVFPKTMTPEQWLKAYRKGRFDDYIATTYSA